MTNSLTGAAPNFGPAADRAFFKRSTLVVCRALIGAVLVHRTPAGIMAGRIVEAEAYLGPEDLAAHTSRGRLTPRNRAMHGPKGHAYLYIIYGLHWCFNIVTGPAGKPQAVLIRALEPLAGLDLMRANLAGTDAPGHSLCRGPGKLCRASGLDGSHYGIDLTAADSPITVHPTQRRRGERIGHAPRIGVDYAGAWATRPWRMFIAGNACVSGPKSICR